MWRNVWGVTPWTPARLQAASKMERISLSRRPSRPREEMRAWRPPELHFQRRPHHGVEGDRARLAVLGGAGEDGQQPPRHVHIGRVQGEDFAVDAQARMGADQDDRPERFRGGVQEARLLVGVEEPQAPRRHPDEFDARGAPVVEAKVPATVEQRAEHGQLVVGGRGMAAVHQGPLVALDGQRVDLRQALGGEGRCRGGGGSSYSPRSWPAGGWSSAIR